MKKYTENEIRELMIRNFLSEILEISQEDYGKIIEIDNLIDWQDVNKDCDEEFSKIDEIIFKYDQNCDFVRVFTDYSLSDINFQERDNNFYYYSRNSNEFHLILILPKS